MASAYAVLLMLCCCPCLPTARCWCRMPCSAVVTFSCTTVVWYHTYAQVGICSNVQDFVVVLVLLYENRAGVNSCTFTYVQEGRR